MNMKMRGFTLVEMVTTVALMGMGMTCAVSSYTAVTNNNQLASSANQLLYDLYLARGEAIKREARVTMCKKTTDSSDCTTNGDWSQGWLVFVDEDADAQVDAGELVVAVNDGASGDVTISGDQDLADYVSYVSSGRSRMNDSSVQDGTLTLSAGGKTRRLIVSSTGRPRVQG